MINADRTPILVGVAQLEQRASDPLATKEPLKLMIEAVRAAAEDAHAPELLKRAGAVRVVRGMWPYSNPAAVVADAIGNPRAKTGVTTWGGNSVQSVLSASALEIAAGTHEAVVLTGAECGQTQARARRAGVELDWQEAPGEPDERFGVELKMRHRIEAQRGIAQPIEMYPIFENALRHARGESLEGHIERVSELWAGFSRVAAGNPHAWIREEKTAEEIRTPSGINRPVSFPYPKFMNSNSNVDQAAALILCSAGLARNLGVPADRWIHPWAATEARDTYAVSNRDNLHTSPGIRIAGGRCLELAGVDVDAIDQVDIYSCFPSAVQVSAAELGISEARPLTVTGGLTFGGGPLNNYVMHAIARMAEVLREEPRCEGPRHQQRRFPHQARLRHLFHRAISGRRLPARRTASGSGRHPHAGSGHGARGGGGSGGLYGDVWRKRAGQGHRGLSHERGRAHLGQHGRCRHACCDGRRGVLRAEGDASGRRPAVVLNGPPPTEEAARLLR